MKRYLLVVVLVIVMVLSGCGDSTLEQSDGSANTQTTNTSEQNDVPAYVQQIYDGYRDKIQQHGDLVAGISKEVDKDYFYGSVSYSFSLYPTKDDSYISRATVFFDGMGRQSFYISVEKSSGPYMRELMALTLLVLNSEMQISDVREIVDQLSSTFYVNGEREKESDKMVIGDYTVYFKESGVWYLGAEVHFDSTKTAFDVYDFDKSEYQLLTYDIYTNPTGYENKLFYIEGTFGYTPDGMSSEIIDTEGNHYIIKDEDYRCDEGVEYRLYGKLKTDVYGSPYLYVEYPYGL